MASFPGLVDVCLDEQGKLVYLMMQDGKPSISDEYYNDEDKRCVPPAREHFQFTLPSVKEVCSYLSKDDPDLGKDIVTYLKQFSGLDDEQWEMIRSFIFLTYLHDHPQISYCPYLLFFAVPERGKTRTGKSICSISRRALHLVDLREANVFRAAQHLHATLFFDLLDVGDKAKKGGCEDMLLLRYEKGAKVSRVLHPERGAFKDTVYYDIYGPTIFASNKSLHDILTTRCLPIVMPNRPGIYKNLSPESGISLKERLTAWRAKNMNVNLPEVSPPKGVSGRLWDISKPLFQICKITGGNEILLSRAISKISGEKADSKKDSVEGRIVGIIKELTEEKKVYEKPEWRLSVSSILQNFNDKSYYEHKSSAAWMGRTLASLSLKSKKDGKGNMGIVLTQIDYRTLLEQYGYVSISEKTSVSSVSSVDEEEFDVFQ